jgi:Domain of unknown function (DUF4111)
VNHVPRAGRGHVIAGPVASFARRLATDVAAVSHGQVLALYVHGSAVLGGWSAEHSDVDLLLVADDAIDDAALARVGATLAGAGNSCPGRGLESSLVTASSARTPAPPWPFRLHVATGPHEPAGGRVVRAADGQGDRDLLMHFAVCREAGWAAAGPPPAALIGAVPRTAVLSYLADELDWGIERAPEPYAVLNACRALVYRSEGEIVSKIDGGEAALKLGLGPAALIERALAQQRGRAPEQPPAADAAEFVRAVAGQLRAGPATS